ncbi:hypothetical protein BD410DRAFT_795450 [Rickenella mellea]|uniref:Uncharacterized protein n=1 Tax=Rickenella mellea TaxID=50990 RepID=A0A4Y7PMQ9_9AGAM|nr:hypothetical protein BD410DRAFT_795450 [Rickenella mellea]
MDATMFITIGAVHTGSAATHFTRILRNCDRLVGFSGSWPGTWQFNHWDADQIQIMGTIPRGVQYLDFNCMMARKPEATPFFTRLSPTLIAMRISRPLIDKAGFGEAQFPRLTHLDLSHLHTYCLRSMQNWAVNSLVCLSISDVPVGEPFFQALDGLGTSLISLRLGTGIKPSEDLFTRIFTLATALEKFRYQFDRCLTRAWSTIKYHSSLCHITCDVCNNGIACQYDVITASIGAHFMDLDPQRLPALRCVVVEGLQELRMFLKAPGSKMGMEGAIRELRSVNESLGNSGVEVKFGY